MMFNFFRKKHNAREKQTETVDPREEAIFERGKELAEISRKRHEAGIPQHARSQEDLTTVMYVFTEQWDYAIFRIGIDLPLSDDGTILGSLKKDGFLQLNDSIHIHASQIRTVDLGKRHVSNQIFEISASTGKVLYNAPSFSSIEDLVEKLLEGKYTLRDQYQTIRLGNKYFDIKGTVKSSLLEGVLADKREYNWVDIENHFYQRLKEILTKRKPYIGGERGELWLCRR